MARSRSSFELTGAIAAASALSGGGETGPNPRLFRGVALVSFGGAGADAPLPAPAPAPAPPAARARVDSASDVTRIATPTSTSEPPESIGARPPKLPDLSAVVSPVVRCEKILEWIGDATGATDVFLSDASGLPIAGAIGGADVEASLTIEARLAASGLVASSVAQLASSLPGSGAPLFELSLGDGPFFQVIGFTANGAAYLVGLFRGSPLTVRQAHAIRLACRHALGDQMGSVG
jgi:hypothetical protein